MPYCEVLKSPCNRIPACDIGRCDACSESLIFVQEEVERRGLLTSAVLIYSAIRREIGAYNKSTGVLIAGVTRGLIKR